MRTHAITLFVELHRQITSEKRRLEKRLAMLDRATPVVAAPLATRVPVAPLVPTRALRLGHRFSA